MENATSGNEARPGGRSGDRDSRLGNWGQTGREWRPNTRCSTLAVSVLRDVRMALRVFRRSPLFTAAACLCLAIGVAVNSAMFTILHELVIDPLPFARSHDLVAVGTSVTRGDFVGYWCSMPDYHDWTQRNRVFEAMTAIRWVGRHVLGGVENPARLLGIEVTHSFTRILGVQPALGRGFAPEEERPGAGRVVLLSHAVWQQHFGGDRTIIGRTIRLDSDSYQVVGVMPPRFTFPDFADYWVPATLPPDERERFNQNVQAIGRLKRGTTVEAARAEFAVLWAGMTREHPELKRTDRILVAPLGVSMFENLRPLAMLLFGASCLVLLLACGNLANLLLARAMDRRREIAIRGALGAGRWRIARQFLVESLMVAALGGAVGVGLGRVGLTQMISHVPRTVPPFLAFDMDGSVFAVQALIVVGCAVLFGAFPAVFAGRVTLGTTLGEWTRGFGGSRRVHFFRSSLVALQLSLACVVLVATVLIVKGFLDISANAPGFDPRNLVVQQVTLPAWKYPSRAERVRYFRDLVDRARALPSVTAATLASEVPMGPSGWTRQHSVEGFEPQGERARPISNYRVVDTQYFATLGIPLALGRGFTDSEPLAGRPVAVVNRAFVRRYCGTRNPIGLGIGLQARDGKVDRVEVVGVVEDVRENGLQVPAPPCIYVPLGQEVFASSQLVVRTSANFEAVFASIRSAVRALDQEMGLVPPRTMQAVMDARNWQILWFSYIFGVLAPLALAMALIGVFSVVSYVVSQRNREFAIRVATGATPGSIYRLVLKKGLVMSAAGLGIGLAASAALGNVLRSMLLGVSAGSPWVYGGVFLALFGFTLVVSSFPARRAARVNPVVLLNEE